jgi:hypothetical protein
MTSIEKHIVKYIEDKFGFPYLHYDKLEQTWANEFFLFDINTSTMYVSDEVKQILNKKFGKDFINKIILTVVNAWFQKTYKLKIEEIV